MPEIIMENLLLFIIGASVFVFFCILIMIARFLKKVEPGQALIIISPFSRRGMKVKFSGGFVFPIIHKFEIMDISTKKLSVHRSGTDGLICQDNIRADITVNFYVRVNNTYDDVLHVAQAIGCERASAIETLDDLFSAKFAEALKTVGKQMDYSDLFQERDTFKEKIISLIGRDLGGYSMEDTAIDYLQQTPMDNLDPLDIMDSEGIRKITNLTSKQAIETNRIQREKEETITKRDVEARERILELERQQQEAELRQRREIENVRSKEEAEIKRVAEEERLRADSTRITTEEQLEVAEQNKLRQVTVAQKNVERTAAVEAERVERERSLEQTEREKLVALAQIEKERQVEEEKKKIQDIIRQRVAVQRTVAEEEEKTQDTHAFADAERQKKVAITLAEKSAEEQFVKDIKLAEAKERAATHLAKEREISSDAEKVASQRISDAKKIMAEGITAEESARGLAQVKVKEADADAVRKMAEAEADGSRMKGLAEVEVKDADSAAVKKMGQAEADALKHKLSAEASGITEKAKAMQNYDEATRGHEEFRLKLDVDREIAMERLKIQKDIVQSQAQVLAAGLQNAKIEIVGGESQFFERITGALTDARTVDTLVGRSDVLTDIKEGLLKPGSENLITRVRGLIESTGITSETIRNLTLSQLFNTLSSKVASDDDARQVSTLYDIADRLGLANLPASLLLDSGGSKSK